MSNTAQNIISKFGGAQVLAELLNINVSNVHRWTYPKSRGGTGGVIPTRHQLKILKIGKKKKIKVNPQDFFPRDAFMHQLVNGGDANV